MIVDIIVSDLVPLRERGNYMAFVLMVYFVGMALGPYVGGAFVENTTWRWVFWINLPVSSSLSPCFSLYFVALKLCQGRGCINVDDFRFPSRPI